MTPRRISPVQGPATGADRKKALTRLRRVGLRSTHQRVQLLALLIHRGNRHVTADDVFRAAQVAGIKTTLATVYNVLHELTRLGVLREIGIDGSRVYFDTNLTPHLHLYFEDSHSLHAIPVDWISTKGLAARLGGIDPERLDIVIRVGRYRQ